MQKVVYPNFTFKSVVYKGYRPPREGCRCEIRKEAGGVLVMEYEDWETLFTLLGRLFPGVKIDIPDEIEIIVLDKKFRRIS
jgi:hypothetical protein